MQVFIFIFFVKKTQRKTRMMEFFFCHDKKNADIGFALCMLQVSWSHAVWQKNPPWKFFEFEAGVSLKRGVKMTIFFGHFLQDFCNRLIHSRKYVLSSASLGIDTLWRWKTYSKQCIYLIDALVYWCTLRLTHPCNNTECNNKKLQKKKYKIECLFFFFIWVHQYSASFGLLHSFFVWFF